MALSHSANPRFSLTLFFSLPLLGVLPRRAQGANTPKMTIGSLFAGVGGFDIAAEAVGMEVIFQVEIDPFCRLVNKMNFPYAKAYQDIKTFDGTRYRGAVDIVCGGFPCQPFSTAGSRAGTNDNRYLWPDTIRVIREIQPDWAVLENVPGLISMGREALFAHLVSPQIGEEVQDSVLQEIFDDLTEANYSFQTFLIPASGIGADHLRYRLWIVARRNDTDDNSKRFSRQNYQRQSQARRNGPQIIPADATHHSSTGLQRNEQRRTFQPKREKTGLYVSASKLPWEITWIEAAASFCRMDDGLPDWLDGYGKRRLTNLIKRYGRRAVEKETGLNLAALDPYQRERIKAMGNAIVPQIAEQIFRTIQAVENDRPN